MLHVQFLKPNVQSPVIIPAIPNHSVSKNPPKTSAQTVRKIAIEVPFEGDSLSIRYAVTERIAMAMNVPFRNIQ